MLISLSNRKFCIKMYKTCNFTPRPGEGARSCALGGQTLVHWAWPGTARERETGPPSCRSTTHRRRYKGTVQCVLGSAKGWTPWRTTPWVPRLATGALSLTSLVGKQPELVREAERYQLDIWSLYNCCALGPHSRQYVELFVTHSVPNFYGQTF